MYQAPTVKRAFQILDLIARRDKRLTISDLSRELGISKSTVHGIAQALEGTGAVVRDHKTRRYSLGLTLFELGRKAYARIDLRDIARPYMEELMRSTRQTVFLGIRAGDHVSIIDIVESTQELKITAHIGARLPLLVGATGKVFMAFLAENEADQLIRAAELRQDTERSITDPDRYVEEIRKARACGYALDDEEYLQGVRAVAVPIHAPGSPMSAIWVVGFTQSIKDGQMAEIAMKTKHAAEAISREFDPRLLEGKER
jgi:DNA-binding IclR family transcriptional regulator